MEVDPKPVLATAPTPDGSKKESANVTPPKDFDVDAYISSYTGHTRFRRLIFLAFRSKELETECLKKAIDELKKTQNAMYVYESILHSLCLRDYRELYEKVPDKIDKLGPQYALDKAWLDACDKRAAQTQERLENDLNSSRTALLKENIRVCSTGPCVCLMSLDGSQRARRLPLRARRSQLCSQVLRPRERLLCHVEARSADVLERHQGTVARFGARDLN